MNAIAAKPKLPGKGEAMYGLTFDLDTHVLEDEIGVPRSEAYSKVERILAGLGYEHVQYSVYVCADAASGVIGLVRGLEALKSEEWFRSSVKRIHTFKLDEAADALGYMKSDR